jgi:hypothetical protein
MPLPNRQPPPASAPGWLDLAEFLSIELSMNDRTVRRLANYTPVHKKRLAFLPRIFEQILDRRRARRSGCAALSRSLPPEFWG